MHPDIRELLERIRQLEEDIERTIARRRLELQADFTDRRVHFTREVRIRQRRFRIGLGRYLRQTSWRHLLSAPFIYGMIAPLLVLDLTITLYQWICFPLYRIPRVHRDEYLLFDRAHLGYLNLIEKVNCVYCSYANGLAAYAREIVARTELYWCPIKYPRRVTQSHGYYQRFVDYGDAEAYRRELRALRAELARETTATARRHNDV